MKKTILVVCLILIESINGKRQTMKNLVETVFNDYDPGLRPVRNYHTMSNVSLKFGIIQLLDVEEVVKTISCVAFVEIEWQDEFISWDPAKFDNISRFRYPHTKIWKPDIILTNTPDLNHGPVMNAASTNAIISSDGSIDNSFVAVFRSTCPTMDMIKFPFDRHRCFLEFTSWTYSIEELDLLYEDKQEIPMTMKLVQHSEWDIVMDGFEKLVETDCCPNDTYSITRVYVILTRKPLYFLVNIIIPTTITCYISFFGMFSPSSNTGERTEKAFLGITTLLAVSLLMLTVSARMPVTSTGIPLLGFFLGVYIILIALSIVCTSIIMQIDLHGLSGKPVPIWPRKWILEKLGKWLRLYDPNEPRFQMDFKHLQENENSKMNNLNKFSSRNGAKPLLMKDELLFKCEELIAAIDGAINQYQELWYNKLYERKAKIELRRIHREEWSVLCCVLDRICLLIFLAFSTIFTIVLMSH